MDDDRDQDYIEEPPKPGPPWGFFLVLAAILVVAIMYSVTIYFVDDKSPETVFGAMAASFTVIGTLVGTYFGVKAGLDGQEKVRHTLARAANRSGQRPQGRTERNQDTIRRVPPEDQPPDSRQHRDQRGGDRDDRQNWEEIGV